MFRGSVSYPENGFNGLKPPGLGQPEPPLSHPLPDGSVPLKQLDNREAPLGPGQSVNSLGLLARALAFVEDGL